MRAFVAAILIGYACAAVRLSETTVWTLNKTSNMYTINLPLQPRLINLQFILYVNYKIQNCGTMYFPDTQQLYCDYIGFIQAGVEFNITSNFVLNCTVNYTQPPMCSIPKVYPCQNLGIETPQIIISPDLEGLIGGMISLYLFLFGAFFLKYR